MALQMRLDGDLVAKALARRVCQSGDLRALRLEAGFTLEEVSRHLSVDSASLSRWERNVCQVKGERAVRLGELVASLLVIRDAGIEREPEPPHGDADD
jgi:transcriptional regulator with XRE-family HTH domain